MKTTTLVRRSERPARLLIAAGCVPLLLACGQPRDQRDAVVSTPSAIANAPAESMSAPRVVAAAKGGMAMPDMQETATRLASRTPNRQSPPAEKSARGAAANPRDALASLELIGTGIDGSNAFAVVKTRNDGVMTVREGHAIGPYTVREIRPDRVRLASSDEEATLVIGAAPSREPSPPSAAGEAPPDATSQSRFIAAGINTDQSIPEHVVFGPTARWQDGKKHVH
jgi:hypothetical protein